MTQSGYGLTLSGSTSGSLTGIKSVAFGKLKISFDQVKTVADVNRVLENVPLGVEEEPMVVTFKDNPVVEAALRDAVKGQTLETWTFTDSEGSTRIGAGYTEDVGGHTFGTDGTPEFSATIRPQRSWALTERTTTTTTTAA
jgi:hypothetical protein